jgi:amidase
MDATDLCFAGAAEQARLVAAGEVSARELVEASLDRIWRLDPVLNTFRVVFSERALTEADQADARRGAGDRRPLLGVPVAIKDDADVAGEVTAWGSLAHGGPQERDSDVVRALREAGAVVIGKTHVPELTIWPFTGSDGAGSIRVPSAFCGLFGIKPQRDRISLGPNHHDAWHGLSVYGPLARRVVDAALFLEAGAGGGGFVEAAAREPGALRVAVSTGPLAVQLVGRPGDEATLLSLVAQIEQARPWADRRPPL